MLAGSPSEQTEAFNVCSGGGGEVVSGIAAAKQAAVTDGEDGEGSRAAPVVADM